MFFFENKEILPPAAEWRCCFFGTALKFPTDKEKFMV
jgi:hypothetical protein